MKKCFTCLAYVTGQPTENRDLLTREGRRPADPVMLRQILPSYSSSPSGGLVVVMVLVVIVVLFVVEVLVVEVVVVVVVVRRGRRVRPGIFWVYMVRGLSLIGC